MVGLFRWGGRGSNPRPTDLQKVDLAMSGRCAIVLCNNGLDVPMIPPKPSGSGHFSIIRDE